MKKYSLKKIISSTFLSATIIAPLAVVVSCGNENVIKHEFSTWKSIPTLIIDNSKLQTDDWKEYDKPYHDEKFSFLLNNIRLNPIESFYSKGISAYKYVATSQLNDSRFQDKVDIAKRASDLNITLFDKGANFETFNSSQGIGVIQNITKMHGVENMDYVTNLTPHTLAEGGSINMDYFIKNGVVYNVPSTNTLKAANISPFYKSINNKKATRPMIVINKNNSVEIIPNVPIDDGEIAQLKLKFNNKEINTTERKNISAFDWRNHEDSSMAKAPVFEDMKSGEVRVITGLHKENIINNIDLLANHLTAYSVDASELNGVTTTDNFLNIFKENTINQAPFKGVVESIDDSNHSYSTVPGKALILVKDSKLDLNIGDQVLASYEFTDKNKEMVDKIKSSKIAFSMIDYGGNRFIWDSPFFKNQLMQDFPENDIFEYEQGEPQHLMFTSASYVIRNNKIYGWNNIQESVNDSIPRQYFVIMEDGRVGIVTFQKNEFSEYGIRFKHFPEIMRALGVSQAIAMDGGGSSQQFIRNNNEWVGFPSSIDPGANRAMTISLGVRGKDE